VRPPLLERIIFAAALLLTAFALPSDRADAAPLHIEDVIRAMSPGNFLWLPQVAPAGPVTVVISRRAQRLAVYYTPLFNHLRRKSASELELSFADIERVIGAMLPNSASRPQWWANEKSEDTRHVQASAWLDAGYEPFSSPGAT
jgi:hypothetical protein